MSLKHTYIYQALHNGKVCRWNKYCVNVHINCSWIGQYKDKQQIKERIKKQFQKWEDTLDGKLRFNFLEEYSQDCDIYIDFQRNSCVGVIGQCQYTSILETGEYKKMYITLGLIWDQYFDQNVLHEIGHAIGIGGHSASNTDIMSKCLNPALGGQLSRKDINTIRILYELPLGSDYDFVSQNMDKILKNEYIGKISTISVSENSCKNEIQTDKNKEIRCIPDEIFKIAVMNLTKLSQQGIELEFELQDYLQRQNLIKIYKTN